MTVSCSLCVVVCRFGRVVSKFFHLYLVGLGWVSQLMGWVGSGHTKWTHGHVMCVAAYGSLATTTLSAALRHSHRAHAAVAERAESASLSYIFYNNL